MKFMQFFRILMTCFAVFFILSPSIQAADIEGDAWPEFDIWVGMDEEHKNRIYILKSFTEEPSFEYQEEATGISAVGIAFGIYFY